MKYELRNPQADDLFVVSKIIKTVGLKNVTACFTSDEVKKYSNSLAEKETITEDEKNNAGIIIMGEIGELIFNKLDLVKPDLYKFMSNVSGLTVDEIATMDICDFAEMFIAIIKNPKFADFIKVVLKSFNLA